ncbi:unnamed protein product [Alternaria alternata]
MGMEDYSPGSVCKHKSWRTTLLLPWAALLMISGFAVRLAGAYDTDNLAYLIASTVLIMSGPPVYALINYFILSRLLYYVPYLAPLHPGRVATTFIGLDGVCEILIGQGAWRMADSSSTDAERKLGSDLVTASLCLQAALFGAFGLLAAQFHRRANKAGILKKDLRVVLYVMYVSASIVTIRCIYRLVEYILGWESSIYQNEIYFWIFEAVIMALNTALLNIFHPGKRLPPSNTVFLARDGVTERKGPGWGDDRPWIITIFDPFDLWGLVKGKDKKTQFWDMSDAELEAARAEKKKRKRGVLKGLLDPFHLWGERGYISKYFKKDLNSGSRSNEVGTQHIHAGRLRHNGNDTHDTV